MNRKTYVKPSITRLHTGGALNKFGASPYFARPVRTEIDGVPLAELTERYGSPLFVFSERALRQQVRDIRQAFTSRYPKVTFGWSYKTNYLDAICAVFHQEGSIAEVVSEMEYQKARRLGVPGDEIIFNGPNKSLEALKLAAGEGARIHIDHFDEIEDLEQVAAELGMDTLDVAIRINLDSGIQPQWSRFGFNLESGQAMDAVRRIHAGGRLRLNGLHCHIGTFMLEPGAYRVAMQKLVDFGHELEDGFGFRIGYYDIGGGLPSRSRLKGIYFPPEVAVPGIDAFAEEITEGLYSRLRPGEVPELVLESGRAMVDEAGYLVTTVKASKRLPDGRRAYVLDAGVNLLYTATWYNFTVEPDRELQGMNEVAILNGPLCMNIDVVDEAAMLPPMPRGTRLTLSPVGAYNVTQWMQFIEYRPAVVLIDEQGGVDVIRRREDLESMTAPEVLPQRLAL